MKSKKIQLTNKEPLYVCNYCGKLTPLIRKTDYLSNEIHHEYAECTECGVKVTIMFTNKKIRGLMAKQRITKPGNLKVKLVDKLNYEINKLRLEME